MEKTKTKQNKQTKKQLTCKKEHFNEIAVNRNYDSSFYEMSNIRRNNIKIPPPQKNSVVIKT